MSVMSIACAMSGSSASLLALRLVQGIGVGGEMPVAAVYINASTRLRQGFAEAGRTPGVAVRDSGFEPRVLSRESPVPSPESRLRGQRWTELLSGVYRGRTLIVWTLWACAYFITNGLNNWMPTLYGSVYHLSLSQALRAGTLTNVAQVVILLGCAFTIDRIGRRRSTRLGCVRSGPDRRRAGCASHLPRAPCWWGTWSPPKAPVQYS